MKLGSRNPKERKKNVMTSIKEEIVQEDVECFQRRGASVKHLMSHRKSWAVSKGKKDMGRKDTHIHTQREKGTEKLDQQNTAQSRGFHLTLQSVSLITFLVGRFLNA